MITELQRTEIRQYLTAKQLPIDVLMEMEDHFKTQIENMQQEKNCDFEVTFSKTKSLWIEDFKMVRKSLISFRKVPQIVKDIQISEVQSLLKKAIAATSIFTILSFFFAHFVTLQNFSHFLLLTNSAVALPIYGLLIYYLFSNVKKPLVRAEIYYYNQLLIVFFIPLIIALLKSFAKIPDISMYLIYNNSFAVTNVFYIIYNVMEDVATNIIGIYFLLFLVNRYKAMKKIKKYQIAK